MLAQPPYTGDGMYRIILLSFALVACGPSSAPDPAAAAPEVHHQTAMPKTLLVVDDNTPEKAKFPAIDFHVHARSLKTRADYEQLVAMMDEIGMGAICNMDGGHGEAFDKNMELVKGFEDRVLHFARVNWEGINEPGWAEKAAAELERCFDEGAHGLKISKVLGLELQNEDGTYIHTDDPRLDAIWQACARRKKPVMMHVSDPVARFYPIGPENERYEAGMWRDTTEGNYYETGQPHFEEIFEHREKMLQKHPETTFVMAHVASMGWDLARVKALLDAHPNVHVEISARLQELGRQPYTARKFFLEYADRILFGTDGSPSREPDEFWRPHWRFLETDDEYFDHPAQMLSPLGAPLQGRWKIYGIFLPDEVLRKVYRDNALRFVTPGGA